MKDPVAAVVVVFSVGEAAAVAASEETPSDSADIAASSGAADPSVVSTNAAFRFQVRNEAAPTFAASALVASWSSPRLFFVTNVYASSSVVGIYAH